MSKLYLVDYYSKGAYKNKIVKAESELEAIKKSRVKNIEEIRNNNLQWLDCLRCTRKNILLGE